MVVFHTPQRLSGPPHAYVRARLVVLERHTTVKAGRSGNNGTCDVIAAKPPIMPSLSLPLSLNPTLATASNAQLYYTRSYRSDVPPPGSNPAQFACISYHCAHPTGDRTTNVIKAR